jgi:hypothetical protein
MTRQKVVARQKAVPHQKTMVEPAERRKVNKFQGNQVRIIASPCFPPAWHPMANTQAVSSKLLSKSNFCSQSRRAGIVHSLLLRVSSVAVLIFGPKASGWKPSLRVPARRNSCHTCQLVIFGQTQKKSY